MHEVDKVERVDTQIEQPNEFITVPGSGVKKPYVSEILKSLLDKVKYRVTTKDLDWVCVVDGREGSGKSIFAQQVGKYLDPTLDITRITFNAEDFVQAIKSAPKFSCVILDEAYASINARASLTETNRALIAMATEMRQKNLFVIICIPSIFDLDKYFAIWRANSLFHVYFDKEYNRGTALFFPFSFKKNLYILGKKHYNYSKPKSTKPPIRFLNRYEVDETEYRKKKAEAFQERMVNTGHSAMITLQRDILLRYLLNNTKMTNEQIQEIFTKEGLNPPAPTLLRWVNTQTYINRQLAALVNKQEQNKWQRRRGNIKDEIGDIDGNNTTS